MAKVQVTITMEITARIQGIQLGQNSVAQIQPMVTTRTTVVVAMRFAPDRSSCSVDTSYTSLRSFLTGLAAR